MNLTSQSCHVLLGLHRHRLPRLPAELEVGLLVEPDGVERPVDAGLGPLDVEAAEDLGHELCDLERRDVAPHAGAGAVAELHLEHVRQYGTMYFFLLLLVEHEAENSRERETYSEERPVHDLQALWVRLQPALGSEDVGVVAKDVLVAVDDGCLHADDDSAGQIVAAHRRPLGRRDPFEREAERRVHAFGFLDHRLPVFWFTLSESTSPRSRGRGTYTYGILRLSSYVMYSDSLPALSASRISSTNFL